MKNWRDVLMVALLVMQLATLAMVGHAYYTARRTIGVFRDGLAPFVPPKANGAARQSLTSTATPERWEYVTFAPPDSVYDETLNRLGAEGWEPVNVRRVRSSMLGGDMAYELTLRRRAQPGVRPTTADEQMLMAIEAAGKKRRETEMAERRMTETIDVTPPTAQSAPPQTPALPSATYAPVERGSLSAQVYIDQATHTYFAEDCQRPPRAVKVPKSMAVAQGYVAAACVHATSTR